jgi:hypothetical protein
MLFSASCEEGLANILSLDVNRTQAVQAELMPDQGTLQREFCKKFTGNIGDLPVVFDLVCNEQKLSGSYYYKTIGIPIPISGTIADNGGFEIEEYGNGSLTGKMSGLITADGTLKGTWTNSQKTKQLPISLIEITNGFAQITFKERNAKNCKFEKTNMDFGDEVGCTSLSLHFPVVTNLNGESTQKVNAALINIACSSNIYGNSDVVSIDALMSTVNIESPEETFTGEINFSIETNGNEVLCINNFTSYYNYGAGHPMYGSRYFNFDLRSGNEIRLEDLLVNGFERELNRIGESKFIKEYGAEGWDFEPGNFELNRNFAIHPGGLTFMFEHYEIGPYAAGVQIVYIPYKSITKLIKPGSLLSAWIDE